MCERTQEFLQFVNKSKPSSSSSGSALYNNNVKKAPEVPKTKTAFNEAAGEIARGVHKTSALLTKLTNLVRRQGLFDDPTEDINNLIYRIKQDLDELNSKCDSAQQYVESKKTMFGDVNQSAAHNVKVVSHLKTDLMHTTKDFKTVLEMRSSKMKDQQVRKVELIGKGMLSPTRNVAAREQQMQAQQKAAQQRNGNGNGPNGSGGGEGGAGANSSANESALVRKGSNNKMVAPSLPSPYGVQHYSDHTNTSRYNATPHYSNNNSSNNNNNSFDNRDVELQEQQLLLDPIAESKYFDARERAVTEVERTIGELGNLFNRLATMISEQQELVERVDEDIETATTNANKAQDILMKAYEKVSSNTAMYMKIFAILGIFVLFFVLFLM